MAGSAWLASKVDVCCPGVAQGLCLRRAQDIEELRACIAAITEKQMDKPEAWLLKDGAKLFSHVKARLEEMEAMPRIKVGLQVAAGSDDFEFVARAASTEARWVQMERREHREDLSSGRRPRTEDTLRPRGYGAAACVQLI